MIKSAFVEKDATLYSDITTLNTGLDEILEVETCVICKKFLLYFCL